METSSVPAGAGTVTSADNRKMYDPNIYAIFGIFLSVLPVIYMSWVNSSVLPDGEKHRSVLKKYLLAFAGIMAGQYLVFAWALAYLQKGLMTAMTADFSNYSYVVSGQLDKVPGSGLEFAKTITSNASTIGLVLNVILLILILKFTGKIESPFFKEGLKNKTILGRAAWTPLLIGLVFTVLLYVAGPVLIQALSKLFLEF
jgi:hypothetical protein